jgi:hypothetical protein
MNITTDRTLSPHTPLTLRQQRSVSSITIIRITIGCHSVDNCVWLIVRSQLALPKMWSLWGCVAACTEFLEMYRERALHPALKYCHSCMEFHIISSAVLYSIRGRKCIQYRQIKTVVFNLGYASPWSALRHVLWARENFTRDIQNLKSNFISRWALNIKGQI